MSDSATTPSLDSLVANEQALAAIQAEIAQNLEKSIPQPIMVVGQIGSGKTTLLKQLFTHNTANHRRCVWIDGRTVFRADDIMEHPGVTAHTVVFVDDIDLFFTRCSYDEQFKLRRYLYNHGAPMLIGSISRILPAFTEYKAPFFEGVKMTYLSFTPTDGIIRKYFGSDSERAKTLLAYLPETIKSLIVADSIIKVNKYPEKDRKLLLERYSEKYRSLYQDLPTYSQHILNAFGQSDKYMELPEIREKTGLPTNILTAYLKSLQTRDIISANKSIKKHTRYSLKDSLFQLWLANS